jgi:hypothetical protein
MRRSHNKTIITNTLYKEENYLDVIANLISSIVRFENCRKH